MRFFKKPRKGKQPSYIRLLVYRDGTWEILDKRTFPVKKGELVRFRGSRAVYSADDDCESVEAGIKCSFSPFAELV